MPTLLRPYPAINPEHVPTAAEVVLSLEKAGFVEGAPFHLRQWARHIDEDVCSETDCPFCGREGMKYRPFRRGVGRGYQYRAVCECPICGYGFEI